jgi:glycogen operon protein
LVRGEAGEYHLTARGEPQPDESFFVILNAHFEAVDWTMPIMSAGNCWRLMIDTNSDDNLDGEQVHEDGNVYATSPRSLVVFVRQHEAAREAAAA